MHNYELQIGRTSSLIAFCWHILGFKTPPQVRKPMLFDKNITFTTNGSDTLIIEYVVVVADKKVIP